MNKKDLNKLRKKETSELTSTVMEKQQELAKIIAQLKAGKESSSAKKRQLSRDIAQVKTLISEKELIEEIKTTSRNKEKGSSSKKK